MTVKDAYFLLTDKGKKDIGIKKIIEYSDRYVFITNINAIDNSFFVMKKDGEIDVFNPLEISKKVLKTRRVISNK